MAKQKVRVKKGPKKRFFEVEAPLTAQKIHLYGTSVEELDGRAVKIDLTRSLRGKSYELRMMIKADGEKLKAEPQNLRLASSYVRRSLRKGADYIEDSFVTNTRDKSVTIKPFLIARNKISREVRKALRNAARKHLQAHLRTRDAGELFNEIMTNKLQKELSLKLKKIYPLALCEIRRFEIEGDKIEEAKPKKVEKKETKPEEEVKEEKTEVREEKKKTETKKTAEKK